MPAKKLAFFFTIKTQQQRSLYKQATMQRITPILFLLFLQYSLASYGQDNEDYKKSSSSLEFHSISLSPLDFYIDNHTGGISAKIDLAAKKDKHIFKLQGSIGYEYEISIYGPSHPESFFEINFLYGRELSLNNWLYFDVYGGLGFFNISNLDNKLESKTTIGFPIQNRLRFQTKGKFGGGFQFQVNINSLNTIYSPGIFFQLIW